MFDIDSYHGPYRAPERTPEQQAALAREAAEVKARMDRAVVESAAFRGLFVGSSEGYHPVRVVSSESVLVDGKWMQVSAGSAHWSQTNESSPAAALHAAGFRMYRGEYATYLLIPAQIVPADVLRPVRKRK